MKRHASLNRIYRLVWSHVFNSWVAVAETARGRGKSMTSRKLIAATLALSTSVAQAAPGGGQVVSGSGSITQSGNTTTIDQASQNLALNWKTFNVATQETVNFNQPSASALAVNRIFDTNGSRIMGQLNANGQVWLINPNGILFGKDAQVNVGGLVASTLDTADNSTFAGNSTGSIVNEGTINAAHYVALLGNSVTNSGVITAQLGTVALGAGNQVSLSFSGNNLMKLQVDKSVIDSLVANHGLIRADGGMVVMNAGARDSLLASAVNNDGIVEAQTVGDHNGTITLLGGMTAGTVNVGGTLDASAPNGGTSTGSAQANGGFIETSAAHVKVADSARVTTLAANGSSGTWLIDPTNFTIAATGGDMTGAAVNTALAGGNFSILSSSGGSGTAGDINVNDAVNWSANTLTLNAQNNININANLNASGSASLALEYGQGGVAAGNTSDIITRGGAINLPASNSNFTTKQGSNGVVKNYVVITALGVSGSVTITDLQGMSGNPARNYALGANIDATATSGWNAGAGFLPVGTSASQFTGIFDGLGHTISNLTINRPATSYVGLFGYTGSSAVIQNIGLTGGSVSGLSYVGGLVGYLNIGDAISNSYTTGSVTGSGSNVGGLVGLANGQATISNSYATGSVSGISYVGGLSGWSGSGISNSYATGSISGTSYVGGLAGKGNTISNSYATGSVSGGTSYVGGLAGSVSGKISNSYATGSVTGTGTYVGGLVGLYSSTTTISNSYASGSVTGASYVGGLVGLFDGGYGTISNSYATGSVTGSVDYVGGLVGLFNGTTISNSYAIGSVTGTGTYVGGLVGRNYSTISNSFWDTQTSGQATSSGGTGLTTAQMQQQSSFSGWDFTNTWVIYDGFTAPLLRSFLTPLTVTANNTTKVYGGVPTVATGVTYSSTPNANLLGTLNWSGVTNVGSQAPSGLYSNQQGYLISYVNGTLTVTPAPLTVTANAASRAYDGLAYSGGNGVSYSGFVNGETSAVLGGALAYGGSAQGAVNAGSYAITPGGYTSSNYTISYVDGVLTIGNAMPSRVDEIADTYVQSLLRQPPAVEHGQLKVTYSPPPSSGAADGPVFISPGHSTGFREAGLTILNGGILLPAEMLVTQ